jgi:hypothetical protein
MDSILPGKAGGLVQTTQQLLGYNPLEILFLALDAISRAPVRLYGQQCKNGIDVTWLDIVTALRSVMLVVDVVVDMIDVFHSSASIVKMATPKCRAPRIHCFDDW